MKLIRHIAIKLSVVLVVCLIMGATCSALSVKRTDNDLALSNDSPATASDLALSNDGPATASNHTPSGWYDARYSAGIICVNADGTVIELPSYQELYGVDPPESYYPPFLWEFYRKIAKLYDGFTFVDTDSWPKTIPTEKGMTFVCYSYSAFENAAEMPYQDIEENTVAIDASVISEFELIPGTIYICS